MEIESFNFRHNSDGDIRIVEGAIYALSEITQWLDGAQAAVAASVVDHILELLKSTSSRVRGSTCWTVGRLALQGSTAVAVLTVDPCVQLVSLLRRVLSTFPGGSSDIDTGTHMLALGGVQYMQFLRSPNGRVGCNLLRQQML